MPEIIWLDEVRSTNDAARELFASGAENGTAVSARRQTNGRGQYGRTWLFEEGAAAFSVLLYYRGAIPDNLTVRVGKCVAEAIEEEAGRAIDGLHVKLPNDILIGDKKICGILTEAQTTGEETRVVCGIGINVNCERIPAELDGIATSLFLQTGERMDITRLICGIQRRLIALC